MISTLRGTCAPADWAMKQNDALLGPIVVRGRLEHVRFLNGDQTHQGRHVRLEMGRIGIQRVKLYRYR